jgi:hypothetical protein
MRQAVGLDLHVSGITLTKFHSYHSDGEPGTLLTADEARFTSYICNFMLCANVRHGTQIPESVNPHEAFQFTTDAIRLVVLATYKLSMTKTQERVLLAIWEETQ